MQEDIKAVEVQRPKTQMANSRKKPTIELNPDKLVNKPQQKRKLRIFQMMQKHQIKPTDDNLCLDFRQTLMDIVQGNL